LGSFWSIVGTDAVLITSIKLENIFKRGCNMKKIVFSILILLVSVSLVGCTNGASGNQEKPKIGGNDEAAVISLVENFGGQLQKVSLLAPKDKVEESMQENYGELVSLDLLQEWVSDPQDAPGRMTSSPWPDRIENMTVEKMSEQAYEVKGDIIEITSTEKVKGGIAAKRPITLTVYKTGKRWKIDAVSLGSYQEANNVVYRNNKYGFSFTLPKSWKDYSIITGNWEGMAVGGPKAGEIVETGPMIFIRHPQWTSENLRQDIPIMVFTLRQWDALQQDEFHIGPAPIGPSELGRNTTYVFALPARYNYAFPSGYEEVEKILESNPLQTEESMGSTSNPKQTGSSQNDYSKEKLQDLLASKNEISKITWSPDDTQVVYVEEGNLDNGLNKAYLWKVGEANSRFVRDVSPTTYGFTWAPDNEHFLISEKLGEGAVSSIVGVETLTEEEYKIKSISIPVWSPDGLALASAYEQHNYGESWGSLEVYTLGEKKGEYIWKAKDVLYKVSYWDKEGNIGYTEIYEGKETKKTTKNIRPSIVGVHLGDTKDQVREVLGNGYEETPPSGEMGHFPEQVYRWTYDEGYQIFIGEESGKVLEIMATSPKAETNLGVRIGDTAAKVFKTYRSRYIEPESIHGGKLYGIFKVEGAAALYFKFDMPEGQSQFSADIDPDTKVQTMMLTYPEQMDDSF